ncbi:hypothetical protein VIGAN_02203300 [Vigna angularis var. angularis]|uniref:Uncharacterized protein n=1 Tax=Vigna angularis var. angularis TaxID=157739 RepID=A0A0S3RFD3_PHAAN|nr:hypothetical protein VIGAN_02203300 [Vigna angularis var. angularis]
MTEKEDTSLELKELVFDNLLAFLSIHLDIPSHSLLETSLEIYAHELACLTISKKVKDNQSHTYSLIVYLRNIHLILFEHCIFNLKSFDDICKWVFDPGGKPPNLI